MRLKLSLTPKQNLPFDKINKHTIQGFVYNLLKDTEFGEMHNQPRFKFWCFSDMFPPNDFVEGEDKYLLISSPRKEFINVLYEKLDNLGDISLNNFKFEVSEVKKFDLKVKNKFITGSPIVLYKDKDRGKFIKFYDDNFDLMFFIQRLQDNAIKKYKAFYGEEPVLNGFIFDRIAPRVRNGRVDVYVRIAKKGKEFLIIGTTWKLLEKIKIRKEERKFYKFIMDCGLGEKNSLGFGFLNPIK